MLMIKIKRAVAAFAAIFLIAITTGLSFGCAPEEDDGKLIVAVTIVPQAALVEKVGGELVKTVVLVPPGYSPEAYEPTPLEMVEFNKAAVYFSIGVPAETSAKEQAEMPVTELDIKVAEVYPDRQLGEERDPHIWLSPKRAVVMVRAIADKLAEVDPKNAQTYKENADAYILEIESTEDEIVELLSDVENRKFVVFHPAYGYFADDFGFEMLALEEEGQAADAQHMRAVIDYAKANGIKVIFYQAETDGAQARTFAAELGGSAVALSPLSADYIANLQAMALAIKEAAE